MKLFLLIVLTMAAFAANSVLNRLALAGGAIGPIEFGVVRVLAGAVVLCALVRLRFGGATLWAVLRPERGRLLPVAALCVYIFAFSLAYVSLDAGLGALVLFSVVQITMFGGAVISGEAIPVARWAGAAMALIGLGWLLWPGGAEQEGSTIIWSLLMGLAGVGWGVYSLVGRGVPAPLEATMANFFYATFPALLLWLGFGTFHASAYGFWLAVLSGAVMSGLGYALWYSVLPRISASVAALAQLSVPVIAMAGGMLVLSEALTLRFVIASTFILGGIALGVFGPQRTITSRGS
jgi:drug/metabolite transporter (DMT)-like permease